MVEFYDALCLKEPWLELVLLGLKTLETRTKCLRRKPGEVLLTSSKQIDEVAWEDPLVGGLLDEAAAQRARAGLGCLAGLVAFGGFRVGRSPEDDQAARIAVRMPSGLLRFVAPVLSPRRVRQIPTVRLRPDGATRVAGASQGFFKVPKDAVTIR